MWTRGTASGLGHEFALPVPYLGSVWPSMRPLPNEILPGAKCGKRPAFPDCWLLVLTVWDSKSRRRTTPRDFGSSSTTRCQQDRFRAGWGIFSPAFTPNGVQHAWSATLRSHSPTIEPIIIDLTLPFARRTSREFFHRHRKDSPAPPLDAVETRGVRAESTCGALAQWLPHRMAPAMARLAAILIVLTLTGEPVANALCITWCDQPSERQHCGDVIAQPTSPALSIARSTSCATLLTASPFLREEGRSAYPAIAPATGPNVDCVLTETGMARRQASGDTTRGRPVPVLVLRV